MTPRRYGPLAYLLIIIETLANDQEDAGQAVKRYLKPGRARR
jgi:hypothetical protein